MAPPKVGGVTVLAETIWSLEVAEARSIETVVLVANEMVLPVMVPTVGTFVVVVTPLTVVVVGVNPPGANVLAPSPTPEVISLTDPVPVMIPPSRRAVAFL